MRPTVLASHGHLASSETGSIECDERSAFVTWTPRQALGRVVERATASGRAGRPRFAARGRARDHEPTPLHGDGGRASPYGVAAGSSVPGRGTSGSLRASQLSTCTGHRLDRQIGRARAACALLLAATSPPPTNPARIPPVAGQRRSRRLQLTPSSVQSLQHHTKRRMRRSGRQLLPMLALAGGSPCPTTAPPIVSDHSVSAIADPDCEHCVWWRR